MKDLMKELWNLLMMKYQLVTMLTGGETCNGNDSIPG